MGYWQQFLNWSLDFIKFIGEYFDFFFNFRLLGVNLAPAYILLGGGFLVFIGFAIWHLINVLGG